MVYSIKVSLDLSTKMPPKRTRNHNNKEENNKNNKRKRNDDDESSSSTTEEDLTTGSIFNREFPSDDSGPDFDSSENDSYEEDDEDYPEDDDYHDDDEDNNQEDDLDGFIVPDKLENTPPFPNKSGKDNNDMSDLFGKLIFMSLINGNRGQDDDPFSFSARPPPRDRTQPVFPNNKRKTTPPKRSNIKRRKVDITENIKTLDDLLKIIDKYEDKRDIEYPIDIKKLKALKEPLIQLKNMVGLKKIKNQIIDQVMYLLSNLQDDDQMLHTVLTGHPGCGKCLAKDTHVIMYNGTIKMVQDVKVGDLLMGDDSTPRKVLGTCEGKEEMFEIVQNKGDNYTVNRSHILSLKQSRNPRIQDHQDRNRYYISWCDVTGVRAKTFSYDNKNKHDKLVEATKFLSELPQKGTVIDISVDDYLTKNTSWKSNFKGFKVGIDFPKKEVMLDPYFLGIWLGDGTSCNSEITTSDSEIVQYLENLYKDMKINNSKKDPYRYRITSGKLGGFGEYRKNKNPIIKYLNEYNLINNKHIPEDYKYNSREVRLQLLAGLIDSDGNLNGNDVYEITQKNETLANDIQYLVRSLGFASSISKREKYCIYKGEKRTGLYNIIHMSGGIKEIPVKLKRKMSGIRKQIKDPLVTGIKVNSKGDGEYFGFELDGNGRFLLGDFTVTHNTSLGLILSGIYRALGFSNGKFRIVKRSDLVAGYLGQTTMKTQRVIDEMRGGVLFIDEVYSLGNSGGGDSFAKEAIDCINQNLTERKTELICIIAGYKKQVEECFFSYNPGLSRRFPFRYELGDYNDRNLHAIFRHKITESQWTHDPIPTSFFSENFKYFKNRGGDMETLSQMSKIAYCRRTFGKHQEKPRHLIPEDIQEGLQLFLKKLNLKRDLPQLEPNPDGKPANLLNTITTLDEMLDAIEKADTDPSLNYPFDVHKFKALKRPLTQLKKMVGMEEIKSEILMQVMFLLAHLQGDDMMLHTVISGNPGCGKTELAHILSDIYQCLGYSSGNFKAAKGSDLIAGYIGQTALKTQELIDEAKGGVLFIDEAYSLGTGCDKNQADFAKEALDCLNQNLTELKTDLICIIAGYKDKLEQCFFKYNPGLSRRFPFRYDISDYTPENLQDIFLQKITDSAWTIEQTPTDPPQPQTTTKNQTKPQTNNKPQTKPQTTTQTQPKSQTQPKPQTNTQLTQFFKENFCHFPNRGGDMETLSQMCKIIYAKRTFGQHQEKAKHLTFQDLQEALELFKKGVMPEMDEHEILFKNHIQPTMYT